MNIENKLINCQKQLETCKGSIDKDIDSKLMCIIEFINGRLREVAETKPVANPTQPQQHVQPIIRPDINNNNNRVNNNNNYDIGFDHILRRMNPDHNDSVVDDYNSIHSLVQR